MQMQSINSLKINNIVTVFAPGCGGNHVANLISTDYRLKDRFKINDYKDNTNKAHYSPILTKENVDIKKILHESGSYVTHFFEYPAGVGFVKLLKKKFVFITMPEEGSKGYHRMCKLYPQYKNNYFYHEMKSLYTKENFIKLNNLNEELVSISGNELFENKLFINYLLEETKKLGLLLNKQICEQIHSFWLSKI